MSRYSKEESTPPPLIYSTTDAIKQVDYTLTQGQKYYGGKETQKQLDNKKRELRKLTGTRPQVKTPTAQMQSGLTTRRNTALLTTKKSLDCTQQHIR